MTEDLSIGSFQLPGRVLLAPMSGITDAPFRQLCLNSGASLAATEMTLSEPGFRSSPETLRRLNFEGFSGIRVIQIAGSEPSQMAAAARAAVAHGAQIVDINMGCPAKKVCRKLAGSALLKDEDLVKNILDAVVDAARIPVTLKIRTGWDPTRRNGVAIAQIAESAGVMALAVHGRTRACRYRGNAEYETIRAIKSTVTIPVFANGDIDTPAKAVEVMQRTGVDGVMIGRAARGQPWLFDQVSKFIQKKVHVTSPSMSERRDMILAHLDAMYRLYGECAGVRVARKHLVWYCQNLAGAEGFRFQAVRATSSTEQMQLTKNYFDRCLIEINSPAFNESFSGELRPWRKQQN